MVPYSGFQMPMQYEGLSISQSVRHTRENASLFDVSHMLQTFIHGADREAFIESLITADVQGLPVGSSALTLFLNSVGKIQDDAVVSKGHDYVYVVSNAGCAEKVHRVMEKAAFNFIHEHKKEVRLEALYFRYSLFALQGPKSEEVLQRFTDANLSELPFMQAYDSVTLCGIKDCRITRCGYTGEDGFEIQIPRLSATYIANTLCDAEEVEPAGLGARDALRLEAGLNLYGNDIDDTCTPVDALLMWTIGKRRRQARDYPGAELIEKQLAAEKESQEGVRITGLIVDGAPARTGATITLDDGETEVGRITSGAPSPTMGKNIAMGYVKQKHRAKGQKLKVLVRGKARDAEVVRLPFVPHKYKRI